MTEIAYVSVATKAVQDLIGASTRFGAGVVAVKNAHANEYSFLVHGRLSLQIHVERTEVKGMAQQGQADTVVSEFGAFDAALASLESAERSRLSQTAAAVSAQIVQSRPYPAIAREERYRTNPSRVLYTHTCPACTGRGRLRCSSCGGSGSSSCGACFGRGNTNCTSCGGSGMKTETYQETVPHSTQVNTRTRQVRCMSCSGGRVRCSACGGSGQRTCGTCSGAGHVVCSRCGGQRQLTDVGQVHVDVRPTFAASYPSGTPACVPRIASAVGYATIGGHGRVALARVAVSSSEIVDWSYDVNLWCCEMAIAVAGSDARVLVFGNAREVFDGGGAVELLLEEDLRVLTTEGKRKRWFGIGLQNACTRALRNFLASQANARLLELRRKNVSAADVARQLRHVVSENYVERAVQALGSAVRVTARTMYWRAALALSLIAISLGPLVLLARQCAQMGSRWDYLGNPVSIQACLMPPALDSNAIWLRANLDTIPIVALGSLPVALFGSIMTTWLVGRRLESLGQKTLLQWAKAQRLVGFARAFLTSFLTGFLLVAAANVAMPAYITMDGRAYGLVQIVPPLDRPTPTPPQSLPPTPPAEKPHPVPQHARPR